MPAWDVHFNTVVQAGRRDIIERIARIHAMASVIRGIPIPPGVQHHIDALNIMRAVRGTTGIEGTEVSEDEVLEIAQAPPGRPVLGPGRGREEQEVRNAQEMMEYVVQAIRDRPDLGVTEDLVRTLHRIITRDIPYPNNVPGQYRSHPVSAGTYRPPADVEAVRRLMAAFVDWVNAGPPREWDPVVRALVAHFYVLSIHPFGDGNGRTARGLESLLLYQAGVNARGFYSLANFYYRNRGEYVRLLDHVRFETNGDLTPFVAFALRGLVEELEAVHSEILAQVRVISFRDYARESLLTHGKLGSRAGERMFHLLLGLGTEPIVLKELREGAHPLSRLYRRVGLRTLARDIDFLVEHRLIMRVEGKIIANLAVMGEFTPDRACGAGGV